MPAQEPPSPSQPEAGARPSDGATSSQVAPATQSDSAMIARILEVVTRQQKEITTLYQEVSRLFIVFAKERGRMAGRQRTHETTAERIAEIQTNV